MVLHGSAELSALGRFADAEAVAVLDRPAPSAGGSPHAASARSAVEYVTTISFLAVPVGFACRLPRSLRSGQGTSGRGRSGPGTGESQALVRTALQHWPRLDRAALARAKGDPLKIARLVTRRSALPVAAVVAILASRPR